MRRRRARVMTLIWSLRPNVWPCPVEQGRFSSSFVLSGPLATLSLSSLRVTVPPVLEYQGDTASHDPIFWSNVRDFYQMHTRIPVNASSKCYFNQLKQPGSSDSNQAGNATRVNRYTLQYP
ncbi:hypothetical protein BaRGS_00031594 [Batillaria attramentaria]|uniref:Uncharacterized protein n=1 Tax=Batillaria attramentaria TaxID=370345 RepID=A0ABD0JQJ6_9CAEN